MGNLGILESSGICAGEGPFHQAEASCPIKDKDCDRETHRERESRAEIEMEGEP